LKRIIAQYRLSFTTFKYHKYFSHSLGHERTVMSFYYDLKNQEGKVQKQK
jgi:hypothetical protein